ncbi:uncharacterized protein LOC125956343 [Anopheles darlingi]|uniref:uncharacterized protein LOC125956343 n=1 Tax=Anopheles darlingi TaxID=43151 RepID=UPI00210039CD|nr:uncharacterized protein LOC125956343 [Anopheles darlingi]
MIINERSPVGPYRTVTKGGADGAGGATTRTTQTTTTIVETWAKLLEHQSSMQSAPTGVIVGEENTRPVEVDEENTATAMGSTVSATTHNYQLRFNVKLPAANT